MIEQFLYSIQLRNGVSENSGSAAVLSSCIAPHSECYMENCFLNGQFSPHLTILWISQILTLSSILDLTNIHNNSEGVIHFLIRT